MTLNFPEYSFKLSRQSQKTSIFDIIRKKFVNLTPEEWVRQHAIQFLIREFRIPQALIAVEQSLIYNQMSKRADIVVYTRNGSPIGLIECKSPDVKLTEKTLMQIAVYNLSLKVPYLWVTNGIDHYFYTYSEGSKGFVPINEWPNYEEMISGT